MIQRARSRRQREAPIIAAVEDDLVAVGNTAAICTHCVVVLTPDGVVNPVDTTGGYAVIDGIVMGVVVAIVDVAAHDNNLFGCSVWFRDHFLPMVERTTDNHSYQVGVVTSTKAKLLV